MGKRILKKIFSLKLLAALLIVVTLLSVVWYFFSPQSAEAAIARETSSANDNGTGATSVAVSNFSTSGTNRVLVATVTYNPATFTASSCTGTGHATVSGASLTWTRVASCRSEGASGTNVGTEVWYAVASSQVSSQTITASFGATTRRAVLVVSAYTGVDTSDPVDASCTGSSGTGTSANAFCTVTTTSPYSLVTGSVGVRGNSTATAGSGLTDVDFTIPSGGSDVSTNGTANNNVRGAFEEANSLTATPGEILMYFTNSNNRWAAVGFALQADIPDAPTLYPDDGGSNQIAFNNIRQNSATPTFRASATHSSTFDRFQLEINTAADFSGTAYTQTFSGSYSSGTQYNLTANSLSPTFSPQYGETYYVRARVSADSGSSYGNWSSGTWSYTYSGTTGGTINFTRVQSQSNEGTNPTATFASGPTQGNLLVAIAFSRSGTSTGSLSISGSGWTKQIARDTQLGNSSYRRSLSVWTKTAGASEPSGIQVSGDTLKLMIQEFSSGVPGASWALEAQTSNDNGTTDDATTIATGTTSSVSAGDLLVITAFGARNGGSGSDPVIQNLSWDSGVSDGIIDSGDTNETTIASGYDYQTASGTKSSTASWTNNSANTGVSAGILVFSASGGGSSFGASHSDWFQTTDAQFSTGTLDDTVTSGENSVELAPGTPVASPQYVSSSNDFQCGSDERTVTASGSWDTGDGLLLWVGIDSTATITPPSGFESLGSITNGTTKGELFAKRYAGEGSFTVELSSASCGTAVIAGFSGIFPTGDFWEGETFGNSNGTLPGVTTTGPLRRLVGFATSDNVVSWTQPTGYTEFFDDTDSGGVHREFASAGSTGDTTWNSTNNTSNRYVQVALIPDAPAASTGTIMSPPVEYDWLVDPAKRSWGSFMWSEDVTNGEIEMQLYYTVSTTCDTIVSDSALSGNSSGFTSGRVDISGLDPTTYDELCMFATLNDDGGTPYLLDWSFNWGTTAVKIQRGVRIQRGTRIETN